MQRVKAFSSSAQRSGGRRNESKMVRGKGRGHDSERTGKKEMNPDVLIRDGKAGWSGGQGKEGGKGSRVAVGSGVRSRFLEPFNDIPEENE